MPFGQQASVWLGIIWMELHVYAYVIVIDSKSVTTAVPALAQRFGHTNDRT